MILAFNQPAFIPWGGFFARLARVDRMVLLDDTLFARGFTFVNRNRIKAPEGIRWITVPVRRRHGQRMRINQLEIHEKRFWGEKWLRTLYHVYGHAPRYKSVAACFEEILTQSDDSFLSFVLPVLRFMRRQLGIETEYQLQTALEVRDSGVRLLKAIAEKVGADHIVLPIQARSSLDWQWLAEGGISVSFLGFSARPYPQLWGPFMANLSALDMILCLGAHARDVIDEATEMVTAPS